MKQFWERIKNYFFQKALSQNIDNVTVREVRNYEVAKKIILLFDASEESNIAVIRKYKKDLEKKGKKVLLFGFIDEKFKEEELPSFDFEFGTKNDCSWNGAPNEALIKKYNLLEQHVDLIVALYLDEIYPLEFLVGGSKATFRVGPYFPTKTFAFDLMMKVDPTDNIHSFTQKIDYFLKSINKDNG